MSPVAYLERADIESVAGALEACANGNGGPSTPGSDAVERALEAARRPERRTVLAKACALYEALAEARPYAERTPAVALAALLVFLHRNQVYVLASDEALEAFARSSDGGGSSPADRLAWLEAHTSRRGWSDAQYARWYARRTPEERAAIDAALWPRIGFRS